MLYARMSKREKKFPGRNPSDQEGIGFFDVARLDVFVLESFQLLVVIFQLLGTLIKKSGRTLEF